MNEPASSFVILRDAQRRGRRILVDSVTWLVYELPPLTYDRRSTTSLVFESDNFIRRVRDFPADWRKLSDDELLALSWSV